MGAPPRAQETRLAGGISPLTGSFVMAADQTASGVNSLAATTGRPSPHGQTERRPVVTISIFKVSWIADGQSAVVANGLARCEFRRCHCHK
jgi:hypothetical protein